MTARGESAKSSTPAAENSPGRGRKSSPVTGRLPSTCTLQEVPRCSLLLRHPEHRALQRKERGPKKEEMCAHPTSRRQKEITEPSVLTVAKPLPQKGERKTLCTAR